MAALLLVLVVAVPFAEISVIVAVAQAIGGWTTLGLLILGSVAGATLVRRQGRRAWNALRSAAEEGRPPDRDVADAGLTLVGGMLLFIPGFVTDVAGLALILPPTRRIGRVLVARGIRRRAAHHLASASGGRPPGYGGWTSSNGGAGFGGPGYGGPGYGGPVGYRRQPAPGSVPGQDGSGRDGSGRDGSGRDSTGRRGAGQVITGEVIESRDEDAPDTRP